jgi:hypothetical protein
MTNKSNSEKNPIPKTILKPSKKLDYGSKLNFPMPEHYMRKKLSLR